MAIKMTTERFIKLSKEKYPGLFTYEKTKVIDNETPVIITSIQYGEPTLSFKKVMQNWWLYVAFKRYK